MHLKLIVPTLDRDPGHIGGTHVTFHHRSYTVALVSTLSRLAETTATVLIVPEAIETI